MPTLTKDQGTGIIERLIYGAVLAIAMKLVAKGYLDPDMAPYIAAGAVGAAGGIYAWWINSPFQVKKAAAALPNTVVVTDAVTASTTPEKNIISLAGDVRAAMQEAPKS